MPSWRHLWCPFSMYTRRDAPDDGVSAIGARPGVVWCGCGGPYRCARAAPREGGTAREHRRSGKRVAGEFHGCCCARPARLQAQVPGKKRNYRQSFAAIWGSTQHLRPVEALGVFGFGVGAGQKQKKRTSLVVCAAACSWHPQSEPHVPGPPALPGCSPGSPSPCARMRMALRVRPRGARLVHRRTDMPPERLDFEAHCED